MIIIKMKAVADFISDNYSIIIDDFIQSSNATVVFPTKMVTSDSLLTLLGLITLFISILSLVKVYRLFKWTDLALSFSTIYISLSVICFIVRNPINIALRVLIYQNND
jgi:hypothetical protein